MNNFSTPDADSKSKVPKHLESLATTVFQSLFPPINPTTTPLKSIRRVLLLNREQPVSEEDDGSFVLNFRHYAITTKVTGISRPLKRLDAAERLINSKSKKGKLPNLSKLQDISDYMIGGEGGDGYMTDATSGSEVDTDAEVEVLETAPRKVLAARDRAAAATESEAPSKRAREAEGNVERRAVKLVELGPRMKLRLTKVEEGLCAGKVMWHEYLHKTQEEVKELEKKWEKKRKEKEERKRQQKENVEKKRKAKAANGKKDGDDEDDEVDMDDLDSDAYDYMDVDDDEKEFDSEGLEGDAETQVNERIEDNGDWEEEEEEIAG